MYPPQESPSSPDPQEIHISSIKLEKHSKPIQLRKSTDTLKNNIDLKDEITKKRTSLKIENNSTLSEDVKTTLSAPTTIKRGDFLVDKNDCVMTEKIISTYGNNGNDLENCETMDNRKIKNNNVVDVIIYKKDEEIIDNKNKNGNKNRNSLNSSSNDDEDDDYQDLENGNTTDMSCDNKNRDSLVSSDDYSCGEMNSINKRILNSDGEMTQDSLTSPNEGPLSRRYAEIAHFNNNKW